MHLPASFQGERSVYLVVGAGDLSGPEGGQYDVQVWELLKAAVGISDLQVDHGLIDEA